MTEFIQNVLGRNVFVAELSRRYTFLRTKAKNQIGFDTLIKTEQVGIDSLINHPHWFLKTVSNGQASLRFHYLRMNL